VSTRHWKKMVTCSSVCSTRTSAISSLSCLSAENRTNWRFLTVD